jgi:MerR family transcriptional regulator, copper efflux regulator
MPVGSLRISELAELAEVPVSTLRYYERIGLLPSPDRLLNGYRVYDDSAVEHLAFIGRAKRMGVPLEQVSELIELWSTGGCRPLQERIRSFLAEKINEVRAQRLELAEFEHQLEGLLGRLDNSDSSSGLCDLDCACVHLDDRDDAVSTCSRFPTMSRGDVSCSLEHDAQAERVEQWRTLIAHGQVEASGNGLRIVFDRSTEIAERVGRLSAEEVSCCSFFAFRIEISASVVVLDVVVPDQPEARALCERVFGPLPETTLW